VFWIYGVENFCWDAEFMLNRKVTRYWRISWILIAPLLLIFIFLYDMAQFEYPTYMKKEYPSQALIAGWVIFATGLSQVFIWSAWHVMRDSNKLEAFKSLFKVNPKWGPKSPKVFDDWKAFKEEKIQKRRIQSQGHSKIKKFFKIILGNYK
jgi:hypothetical protein